MTSYEQKELKEPILVEWAVNIKEKRGGNWPTLGPGSVGFEVELVELGSEIFGSGGGGGGGGGSGGVEPRRREGQEAASWRRRKRGFAKKKKMGEEDEVGRSSGRHFHVHPKTGALGKSSHKEGRMLQNYLCRVMLQINNYPPNKGISSKRYDLS